MLLALFKKLLPITLTLFPAVNAQQCPTTVTYDAVKAGTVLGNFRGLTYIPDLPS